MPILKSGLFVPPAGPHRPFRNPMHGTHAPDGRRYQTCPQCSAVASLKSNEPKGSEAEHTVWRCEACGYVDCLGCPLGDHEKN